MAQSGNHLLKNMKPNGIDMSANNNSKFDVYTPGQESEEESQEVLIDIPRQMIQAPAKPVELIGPDVESIIESLDNLKVRDLKKVHDKSKELLESYYAELQEVVGRKRRSSK